MTTYLCEFTTAGLIMETKDPVSIDICTDIYIYIYKLCGTHSFQVNVKCIQHLSSKLTLLCLKNKCIITKLI